MSDAPQQQSKASPFRIENSERGITITSTLAWTIVVSLIAGALGFGTLTASLAAAVSDLQDDLRGIDKVLDQAALARSAIDARVRIVEISDSANQARFQALADSIVEIKDAQKEILMLIRERVNDQR